MKVFVSFVTTSLYGMERSVIERFEALQPEIEAHFLLTYTTIRLDLPVLHAVRKAKISHSFLSDKEDWPAPRKPRSIGEAVAMLKAIILGNRDTLRASFGKDAFYLSSLRTPFSALLTIIFYRLRGKPVIYGFHDTLNKPSRLLRLLGTSIPHYVFHSANTRDRFIRSNPWAAARNMPVIPNIVKYAPSSAPCPMPLNSRSILFIGQIAQYKGADVLLEAFLQLISTYSDITLHFVGSVHNDFQETFTDTINAPEADGRIIHWGYREDRHDFLKGAYILVQPSRPSMFAESFGRGVVEAMAAGVPAVCFRSGALPEHVIHQETGLICGEESPECLAYSLRILLDDRNLRDKLANAARTRYKSRYSPEIVRKQWVYYFQGLVT